MSFFVNTKYRSNTPEIMDDFLLEGEVLRDTLDKLELINQFLGGNKVTLKGIVTLLKNQPKNKLITIVDLGCGHGDILRDLANYGRKHDYQFKLIGVDANADAIAYAKELSVNYKEITFLNTNVFSKKYQELSFDIAVCTLFLHHFNLEDLLSLLKNTLQKAKIGIVVNDLQRNRWAYYLFYLVSLFIKNKMVRQDGLTSILKAFKRKELVDLSNQLKVTANIKWKWAFRYLWIIAKK